MSSQNTITDYLISGVHASVKWWNNGLFSKPNVDNQAKTEQNSNQEESSLPGRKIILNPEGSLPDQLQKLIVDYSVTPRGVYEINIEKLDEAFQNLEKSQTELATIRQGIKRSFERLDEVKKNKETYLQKYIKHDYSPTKLQEFDREIQNCEKEFNLFSEMEMKVLEKCARAINEVEEHVAQKKLLISIISGEVGIAETRLTALQNLIFQK